MRPPEPPPPILRQLPGPSAVADVPGRSHLYPAAVGRPRAIARVVGSRPRHPVEPEWPDRAAILDMERDQSCNRCPEWRNIYTGITRHSLTGYAQFFGTVN